MMAIQITSCIGECPCVEGRQHQKLAVIDPTSGLGRAVEVGGVGGGIEGGGVATREVGAHNRQVEGQRLDLVTRARDVIEIVGTGIIEAATGVPDMAMERDRQIGKRRAELAIFMDIELRRGSRCRACQTRSVSIVQESNWYQSSSTPKVRRSATAISRPNILRNSEGYRHHRRDLHRRRQCQVGRHQHVLDAVASWLGCS